MNQPIRLADATLAPGELRKPDALERFCAEFLRKTPVLGAVPFAGAVSIIENVTSILLYRRGQFQVQMFAVPEDTVIARWMPNRLTSSCSSACVARG